MLRARARGIALLVTSLAFAGGSAILAPAATAMVAPPTILTIEVDPTTATEGESVEVTVSATDATDLYAYDLAFTIDPALFEFDPDSVTGPDGGFTAASVDGTTLTLTHTRLGTSPGLDGAVALGSFSLVALGGGSTTVALTSATLVDGVGDTSAATLPAPVAVTLAALADPPVEPEPTASATPTPSGTPAALPITGTPAEGQPLATTGADATPWLFAAAGAVVLIAAGALLVIRRRQVVSE
jgi:LPXTG-motif cell wall-anchored protein